MVVPLLLALTWGRFRAAGAVLGTGLALLLHVTVAVGALSLRWPGGGGAGGRAPRVAAAVAAAGGRGGLGGLFVVALLR